VALKLYFGMQKWLVSPVIALCTCVAVLSGLQIFPENNGFGLHLKS